VAAISDFRSDSPLHLICVGCCYLGSSEHFNRARLFTVVVVVRFCCHHDVRGFHDRSHIHTPSSHTRSCFRPYSSPRFSASSDLRCAVVIAILSYRHGQPKDISCRHSPSAGLVLNLVVDLNAVAHLFRNSSAILAALFVRHRKQTTDRKEFFIMHQSRGAISFTPLFTTDDIGLRKDASVEHVVKVFLTVGEAMAARWIEMPRGILLLQAVPDQPASGAIYFYDRERHIFFFVDFVDGRDDTLTAVEFDQLVAEYDLVSWTANPAFLPAGTGTIAMA